VPGCARRVTFPAASVDTLRTARRANALPSVVKSARASVGTVTSLSSRAQNRDCGGRVERARAVDSPLACAAGRAGCNEPGGGLACEDRRRHAGEVEAFARVPEGGVRDARRSGTREGGRRSRGGAELHRRARRRQRDDDSVGDARAQTGRDDGPRACASLRIPTARLGSPGDLRSLENPADAPRETVRAVDLTEPGPSLGGRAGRAGRGQEPGPRETPGETTALARREQREEEEPDRSASGRGPKGAAGGQLSMNDLSCLLRLGWRSLRSAFASI